MVGSFLNALNKIDIGMLKQCVSLVDAWRESRYKDIVSFLEKTWLTDFMQADKGQRSLLREYVVSWSVLLMFRLIFYA